MGQLRTANKRRKRALLAAQSRKTQAQIAPARGGKPIPVAK
jgi:hypothetical protein